MNFFKLSIIGLFSLLFMAVCIPHLSAKHHHRHRSYHSSSFALNVNAQSPHVYRQVPTYVEYVPVQTYQPYVQEHYYYTQPVIIERPYVERVQVRPQVSFQNSWFGLSFGL